MDLKEIKNIIDERFPDDNITCTTITTEETMVPQFTVKLNDRDVIFQFPEEQLMVLIDILGEMNSDRINNSIADILISAIEQYLNKEKI